LNVNEITPRGRILPGDIRRVEIREELAWVWFICFWERKEAHLMGCVPVD